jgi:hypothetical protein
MTTKPQVRIYNEDGSFTDRPMNDEEFAQWQIDKANSEKAQVELEAKEKAKADLLKKLGITQEEADLLLA